MDNLNGKVFFGNKLYCKGLTNLFSHEKDKKEKDDEKSGKQEQTGTAAEKIPEENISKDTTIPGLIITPDPTKNQKKKAKRKLKVNDKDESKSLTAKDFMKNGKPKIRAPRDIPSVSDYEFDETSDIEDNVSDKSKFFKSSKVNSIVDNIEKAIAMKRAHSSPDDLSRRIRSKSEAMNAGSMPASS